MSCPAGSDLKIERPFRRRQTEPLKLNAAGSGEAAGGFDRVELGGPRKPDPPETPPAKLPEEDETP